MYFSRNNDWNEKEKHDLIKINNTNLPSGIYFARVKTGNGIRAVTFIKD